VLRLMLRAILVVGLLPATAYALGFGDIRLNSALNAPLNAEIDISASAEELATLSAGLASRDTFSRNGLDYPAFFATATVAIEKAADGRSLLRVRTPDPVTEPFLTMLIEVSHARGRLVREYTVLLDPPVLATQAVAAPISAPVVSPATNTAPRSAVSSPVVNESPTTVSAATADSDYRVRSGDTLNQIAARLLPGVDRSSALVALYRANPAAFEGNMNEMRAGVTLVVPSAAAVAAIGPSEAASEVRQQIRSWSGAGRLRLVPPGETSANTPGAATVPAGGSSTTGEVAALQRQVTSLEGELRESKRLLELRSAELAALQQRQTGQTPVVTTPVVVPPPVAETPTEPVAVVEPTPVVEPMASVQKPVTVSKPVMPAAQSESWLDKLLANWPLLVGAIAALGLAWFGFTRWQRSRAEADLANDFDRPVTEGFERTQSTTQTLPFRVLPDERSDAILVEESGSYAKLNPPAAAPRIKVAPPAATAKPQASVFEAAGATVTTTAMTIEQGDSLAEADFHMAYGLYDQAAELVKLAIAREPERRDLRVKLLEVFFVWGNKDEFLTQARELATTRSESAPGEWEKIIIMGRQIAAGDPLFTGSDTAAGVSAGGVDLNLEGGHNRVDFNVLGEPTLAGVSGESVDMDFSDASLATGESAASGAATSGIDFVFDDPLRGEGDTVSLTGAQKTTRLLRPDATAEGTALATVMLSDPEGPTAEMPELPSGEQGTIRQKLDAATSLLSTGGMGEQTAELAIDDLGLDIGTMDVPIVHETTVSDQLALSMVLDAAPDAITAERTAITDIGTSGEHLADMTAAIAIEPTMTQMFSAAERTNEVLSLNDDTGSVESPANGFSEDHTATMKVPAPLDADDPPTMSEVGTKLDLARAYMDMGDPEGARSILDEVIHEGSASQKQEARRLMDSLPG
jgi:pilus assembly protein FimV